MSDDQVPADPAPPTTETGDGETTPSPDELLRAENLALAGRLRTPAARTEAQEWRGLLRGDPLQAALVPFTLGVVAVLAPTDYIGAALGQLAQVLTLAALVLVGLSALLGYLVAAAAARPLVPEPAGGILARP